MARGKSAAFGTAVTAVSFPHQLRAIGVTFVAVLVIAAVAQGQPAAASPASARGFFQTLVGEWIGVCEQSTDGEQAPDKYFHLSVSRVDDKTFASSFDYYRLNGATGAPQHIGSSTATTSIGPDGAAKTRIVGKGVVSVNERDKPQRHDLTEVLTPAGSGQWQGRGSGTISVGGMPFGLGKNGKILDVQDSWSLSNGVLSISQVLKVGFRAIIFTKRFSVAANYTARRGSDLASLMAKTARAPARPGRTAPRG